MIVPVYVRERLYIPRAPEFDEVLEELRTKFTYTNPDYIKLKALNRWTGGVHKQVKTWANVTTEEWDECTSFPRGGTQRVRRIFDNYGLKPRFVDLRLSLPPITNLYNDVELRPDQQRLAEAMFNQENCLIRSPTASGKTETALKVAEWILKTAGPVIIIVWESGLLDQWVERIAKRFGLTEKDIGILGGGKKRVAPLTVAMQQTLMRQGFKYSHAFGGMICDEIQRFAAPTYQQVVDIFPARFRIGISADETRNDKKEFLIYDAFGEIADEIEKAQLIEEGKIHEIIIRIVPTEFDYEIEQDGEWVPWVKLAGEDKDPDDFINVLITNEDRNDLIWHFMEPSLKARHTCLIVTRRRAHAIYWDHRIRKAGYTSGLMMGQGKEKGNFYKNEFKRTINGLRTGKVQIGVGTIHKMSTGHDIPQIDRGFVLAPLAGNKQLFEQVMGRFRRICKGKTEAAVYYFWDQLCYPSDKRMISKRYKQTFVWVKDQFLPT